MEQQQLKYLNFYKLISNIATNLVGAFIPLIVLKATGLIWLSVLFIALQYIVRLICNIILRNWQVKYPQLLLTFRIVTMPAYCVFIMLIDANLWVGVVGTVLFYGLDESLKSVPAEVLFSYASGGDTEGTGSKLGFTRLMEQTGVIVALVVGGTLMDINQTLTIIISMCIYAVSVVPLLIFYFKCRGQKTFNQDAISNATVMYDRHPELQNRAKKWSKEIILSYAITYFIFCFQDIFPKAFNIHLFLSQNSFSIAGYLNAIYNGTYGIGCFIFGLINEKYETMWQVIVSCVLCAGSMVLTGYVKSITTLYFIIAISGFAYAFVCTFVLQRLLPKCKILGLGNNGLFARECSANSSMIVTAIVGTICASMLPVFIVSASALLLSAYVIPANEEHTRKVLINYLQAHEQALIDPEPVKEQKDIVEIKSQNKKRRK